MALTLEQCMKFMNSIPPAQSAEFETKYCGGIFFDNYGEKHPDEFIKSVRTYAKTFDEDSYIGQRVQRYLGNLEEDPVPEPEKPETPVIEKVPISSKMNQITREEKPVEKNSMPEAKKYAVPSPKPAAKTPVPERSRNEMNESIARKLFTVPKKNSRYGRLQPDERKYILNNVGFTKDEKKFFRLRCKEWSYNDISRWLNCSESSVKKLAVSVEKQIRHFIQL